MSVNFQIGGRIIGPDEAPYCIAEVGINHNGDLALAKKMIEAAHEAGADAVKFQTFRATEFCGDATQTYTYQSQGETITESMLAMFQRYEFQPEAWRDIRAHCDHVGITFFSTPQNRTDLDLLLDIGVPAIKVGSDDFTNLPLLRAYAQTGLPMILSCGMSDLAEVHQALEAVGFFKGYPVTLLLCTSQYPTPAQDVNARKLTTLKNAFPGLIVGFSDHTQGSMAATVACALGACIFEKHFTLSHNLPGPDQWFSEEPANLAAWVSTIKNTPFLLGSPYLQPTEAEVEMRKIARRSICALRPIAEGEILNDKNIGLRRPEGGLPPAFMGTIMGMVAAKAYMPGEHICVGGVKG